ncbi:MAG: serine/threonine protein kinase [Pseudomonadota bacterium]|nr:MAG: serine/threonine protein kinase [Pseudomonadota bacterium]
MNNDMHAEAIPYQNLTPETVLAAVESAGHATSGHLLALNSYENRVYQVGLDAGGFIVAKFYRPGRWSDETILEEHEFALELAAQDIPAVSPLTDRSGHTLLRHDGFRFALFPRRGGRAPELDDPDNLRWLGRLLGRLHAVGATRRFAHRPALSVERLGHEPYRYLTTHDFIPPELAHNYSQAIEQVLEIVEQQFSAVGPLRQLRLHGDFHPGNVLWTDDGPHFVDLDDCTSGPAVQDLWMLLSGSRDDMERQLSILLEEYAQFFDFDPLELVLVEALRALRLVHYSGWLARRWHDPAFPMHFPWFNTPRYWEEQMLTLREQLERLDAPTLKWR